MNWLELTQPIRHKLVKILAPKLYTQASGWQSLRIQLMSQYADVPRPAIVYLASKGRTGLVGAEIGVAQGMNAESIMETLSVKRLYLIDPYRDYAEEGTAVRWHNATEQADMEYRMRKYGNRVIHLEMSAHEASKCITEELDFVYIDGCHIYNCVKQDIEDYALKVRPSGLLAGHDFAFCSVSMYPGVSRAVTEFAVRNRLHLMVQYHDWWLVPEGEAER